MYAKWVTHAKAQQIPLQFRAAGNTASLPLCSCVQCQIICSCIVRAASTPLQQSCSQALEQLVGKILSYLHVLVMLNYRDFWSIFNTQTAPYNKTHPHSKRPHSSEHSCAEAITFSGSSCRDGGPLLASLLQDILTRKSAGTASCCNWGFGG